MLAPPFDSRECQLSNGGVNIFQFVLSKKLQAFVISNISIKNFFCARPKIPKSRTQNTKSRTLKINN